jgi:hypothetical protein
MCQEAGTYCNEMSSGSSDCLTTIGLCDDFDNACLSAAACTEATDPATCAITITDATCTKRKYVRLSSKKDTMDKYDFSSGVYFYGSDATGTTASCNHLHLYSFYYDSVTP